MNSWDKALQAFKNGKKFYLESQEQSSFLKEKVLSKHFVVSDREISTLDYQLGLFATQGHKYRVVDDIFYPYLKNKASYVQAIELLKVLPDLFIENELLLALNDFISKNAEDHRLSDLILESSELINSSLEEKVAPRSFCRILLSHIPLEENNMFFRSHLLNLPNSFSERVGREAQVVEDRSFFWKNQLEFYNLNKDVGNKIDFINFENQIEEVRYVLQRASERGDSGFVVFYPEGEGYEELLYTYQKEFFKEQVFFIQSRKLSSIYKIIFELEKDIRGLRSHYNSNLENKRVLSFQKNKEADLNFHELLARYMHFEVSEEDLNYFTEFILVFKDQRMNLQQWYSLLKKSLEGEKRLSLHADLLFFPFKDVGVDKAEEIYILGWSDLSFKKNSESLISPNLLFSLEKDLGLMSPGLYRNKMKLLTSKELFWDPTVKKRACFSKINSLGHLKNPSLFKILSEEDEERGTVERELFAKKFQLKRNPVEHNLKSLSASSLKLYEECPYKFYLEKVLFLRESEELDIFLNPLEEGRAFHKMMELLKEAPDLERGEFFEKLGVLVESNVDQFDDWRLSGLEERFSFLWDLYEEERAFLETEGLDIYAVEEDFVYYVDPVKKEFSLVKAKERIAIRGVVDRIDQYQEESAVLYDYKRSSTGTASLKRYTGSSLSPQLFLYIKASELGAVAESLKLLAFQYVNLKENKRTSGFVFEDAPESAFKQITRGTKVSIEEYNEKCQIFEEEFFKILEKIRQNDFKPNPKSVNSCSSCTWSGVCKESRTMI